MRPKDGTDLGHLSSSRRTSMTPSSDSELHSRWRAHSVRSLMRWQTRSVTGTALAVVLVRIDEVAVTTRVRREPGRMRHGPRCDRSAIDIDGERFRQPIWIQVFGVY